MRYLILKLPQKAKPSFILVQFNTTDNYRVTTDPGKTHLKLIVVVKTILKYLNIPRERSAHISKYIGGHGPHCCAEIHFIRILCHHGVGLSVMIPKVIRVLSIYTEARNALVLKIANVGADAREASELGCVDGGEDFEHFLNKAA